jgi:pentatricopeptide repeat protein
MMLVTKLMTELVYYNSSQSVEENVDGLADLKHRSSVETSMKVSLPLKLAWQLWTEFRERSQELPDLVMFNVALTVASKMRNVELLDQLLYSLTVTPKTVRPREDNGGNDQDLEKVDDDDDDDDSKFLKPDLFTYNILIDAYGRCGHLYRALELFDEMKFEHHIKPDVITFNSLAKAYVMENRLDDAVKVIREAALEGVTANYITFRTLCHAFGDSNAMLNELHEIESNMKQQQQQQQQQTASSHNTSSNSDRPSHQSNYEKMLKNATMWNQTQDSCNLSLDLHELNIAEAKAKLGQELEYLHQFYREEHNKTNKIKDGDDYDGDDVGGGGGDDNDGDGDDDVSKKKKDRKSTTLLPDLILITGVGKHSLKKKNKAAMKLAMIEYLNHEGIVFYEASANPGRLIVSSNQLKLFFEKYRIRNMHTSYSDYMSLRYMVLPSVLASVLILPRVSDFYSGFMS